MQRKKSRRIKFTKPIGKERFGRQRAQDSIKKAEKKKGNAKRKSKISNSEKHAGCRRGFPSIEKRKKAKGKNTQKKEKRNPAKKRKAEPR